MYVFLISAADTIARRTFDSNVQLSDLAIKKTDIYLATRRRTRAKYLGEGTQKEG